MSARRRGWSGGLLVALAALCARPALADDAEIKYSLAVTAPVECASDERVAHEIGLRSRRVRHLRTTAPGASALTVTLAASPAGFVGRLTIQGPDGSAAEREIEGATCPEVLRALALVAAVTLDPSATPPDASPLTAPPAPPPRRPAPPAASAAAPPAAPRPWLGAGPTLAVDSGAFSAGALAPGGTLAVTGPRGLLRPAAWIAARREARSAGAGVGTADLTAWLVSLQIGALRLGGDLGVSPVLGLVLGRVSAEARGLPGARDASATYLAAELGLRADWLLGEHLRLDLGAGASTALRRDRFVTQRSDGTNDVVSELAPLGAWASLGLLVGADL